MPVKVRSTGLAILGAALLAAAAVLGALLVHDGEGKEPALAQAAAGDAVEVKGRPEPFFPDDLARWAAVQPYLDAHNSLLPAKDGVVVLLASPTPAPGAVVLAEGTVAAVAPHPTEPGHLLVVVHVDAWREPLVFH